MRNFGKYGLLTILVMAVLLSGCASQLSDAPDVEPGEKPSQSSMEAGLWMRMNRAESKIKNSQRPVQDPELSAYVESVFCKVAGAYCEDVRIYFMDVPSFNAMMAPNGMMVVWTGTLLRTENEAQLAYVLAHELGHYLRRHSVQRVEDVRNKTDALAFFTLATAGAGVGFVGTVAQIAALGSIFAFSRDMEREADDIGFDRALDAGYDPRESAKVWRNVIRESEAGEESTRSVFFATHPAPAERARTLADRATQAAGGNEPRYTGEDAYLEIILPRREALLRRELSKRDYPRTQVVLDALFDQGENIGELHFFQGELYRLEREQGYVDRALREYDKALGAGGAPADIHRSRGLLLMADGKDEQAREAFGQYLGLVPAAADREMIESYIDRLEGQRS